MTNVPPPQNTKRTAMASKWQQASGKRRVNLLQKANLPTKYATLPWESLKKDIQRGLMNTHT